MAKKRSVLKEFHQLSASNQIDKQYLALLQGNWPTKRVQVTAKLAKFELQSGERMVKISSTGKSSITDFGPSQHVNDVATLAEVGLVTGRTHQIRVHAAYKGHPIAGDEKYGDKEFNKRMRRFGLKRLFLHAESIRFELESTQQSYDLHAPLDFQLQKVLESLHNLDHDI